MKEIGNPLTILSILPLFMLFSCMNGYERQLVGEYSVSDFDLEDSSMKSVELPILILNKNSTYVLQVDHKLNEGKWNAGDFGDFTLITFRAGNKEAQGKVIGEEDLPEIEIPIPSNFSCEKFKKIVFKKKLK